MSRDVDCVVAWDICDICMALHSSGVGVCRRYVVGRRSKCVLDLLRRTGSRCTYATSMRKLDNITTVSSQFILQQSLICLLLIPLKISCLRPESIWLTRPAERKRAAHLPQPHLYPCTLTQCTILYHMLNAFFHCYKSKLPHIRIRKPWVSLTAFCAASFSCPITPCCNSVKIKCKLTLL